MNLPLSFSAKPIDLEGRHIGTVERNSDGFLAIHKSSGALPIQADVHDVVNLLFAVDRAVVEYDRAREAYENVYGRHERAMLLGVPSLPPQVLKNAHAAMEKAEQAIAELMTDHAAQRAVEGSE